MSKDVAYLIREWDYDMCRHMYLTLDKSSADEMLKRLNEQWMKKKNYSMTDKDGNKTGPFEIEQVRLDTVLEEVY